MWKKLKVNVYDSINVSLGHIAGNPPFFKGEVKGCKVSVQVGEIHTSSSGAGHLKDVPVEFNTGFYREYEALHFNGDVVHFYELELII